ncbi:large ribosomal subunit protein mL57 [Monosporozyma unispora]|nr:hypothetical protein C6P44_002274 [Kazachstania unispora]
MLSNQLGRSLIGINKSCLSQRNSLRFITYLHSGDRVRGIKRDPTSYMINPYGLTYETVQKEKGLATSEFFSKIRNQLPLKKYNIAVDDNLLLQCFTHKSFAHGKVPYNEKLFIMGSHFLKVQASLYSIQNDNVKDKDFLINGLNFNTLGSNKSKQILSECNLAQLMESLALNKLIFWKKRNVNESNDFNGEPKIASSVLNSVVGAILLTNGVEKTTLFVTNFLLKNKKANI